MYNNNKNIFLFSLHKQFFKLTLTHEMETGTCNSIITNLPLPCTV